VIRTRVGYAGGTAKNPTYRSMGDHTETIQIDFDPSKVGYADLLEIFWRTHNPCARAWSRQYMSLILFQNDEQKRLAQESKSRHEAGQGKIHTEIAPLGEFTRAEDYHQKYYLRNSEFAAEFAKHYPDASDFADSTAAARMNGYVGGHGNAAQLRGEIERLGLSDAARKRLLARIER
jgi:methionine-S-sulfoxide reductase